MVVLKMLINSTMQKYVKYTKMCHNFTFTNYQQYSMVRCPLTEDQFFNHDRAKQWITDDLKRPPHICLYTGPQNSGKTTLLRRCLQDFKATNNPRTSACLTFVSFFSEPRPSLKKTFEHFRCHTKLQSVERKATNTSYLY